MYKLLTTLLLVLTVQSFAYVVPCGAGKDELKHSDYDWNKLFSVQLESSLPAAVDGVVCLGKKKGADSFDKAVYRDIEGGDAISNLVTLDQLLKGMVFLKTSQLPEQARGLIKNGDLIKGKVSITKETVDAINFSFTFIFYRKLGILSGRDIREMTLHASYDKASNSTVVYHKLNKSNNPQEENEINSIGLKLVLTDITEMNLYMFEELKKKIKTNTLTRAKRR